MDISSSALWWIATGALVAIELATGTFYLLMLAIGTAAAGIAAWVGLPVSGQFVAAALIGGGAVAAWHLKRSRGEPPQEAASNRDVNLDVGQTVQVPTWTQPRATRLVYRGCEWNARYVGEGLPMPGAYRIRAVEGSELMLERAPN
jgi:membrane protein implicated in regulation of membrane protease activity